MRISYHGIIRGQQRAISKRAIDLILNFGTTERKPGNVLEYRILKKDKDKIIGSLRRLIRAMDKIEHKAILVNQDEEVVITAYNLY